MRPPPVEEDLHQRLHLGAVRGDELDHTRDVGREHRGGCAGGADPGRHFAADPLVDRRHHLRDQIVLAGEVVGDQAGALEAGAAGDLGERGAVEADLGDRLDRRRHDLRPAGGLGDRAGLRRVCSHEQNLARVSKRAMCADQGQRAILNARPREVAACP
jgi:hypothetical protein